MYVWNRKFYKSLIFVALALGAAGTLVEATGFVGREAVKAHQHGGMSFKWLNQQLVGGSHSHKGGGDQPEVFVPLCKSNCITCQLLGCLA